MTEPEIARRCSSCGASIRVRAFFCPHCGKTLSPKMSPTEAPQDEEAEMPGHRKPELGADTPETSASQQLESEHERGIPTVAEGPHAARPRKAPVQATLGTVHRAGVAPRTIVEDDGVHGVEKWRQLSSAVLDEAAYDPSLRFVLVAAVLFVLFVVMLILSELIT